MLERVEERLTFRPESLDKVSELPLKVVERNISLAKTANMDFRDIASSFFKRITL